uniref:Uncharacterized protein n=1 Tax=Panagrolaimus davidi TaxID=227884 RepID=A0A914QRQ2_9BILA
MSRMAALSYLNQKASCIMSVRHHPLSSLAESFRRLVPAIYEEVRATTTVNYSTDKRQYMAGQLLSEICK